MSSTTTGLEALSLPSVPVSATTVLVALLSVLVYALYRSVQRPKGAPPGPPVVPMLGSLPFMNHKALTTDFIKQADKYGEVFSFYLGNKLAVVLNDFSSIREAFVNHAVAFAGRPTGDPRVTVSNPYHTAILLSPYSSEWKRQRSNALSILRGLGWGKSSIEEKIRFETNILVDYFHNLNGRPIDPSKIIGTSVANVICSLMFGDRYEHDDDEFLHLLHTVDSYFKNRFGNIYGSWIPLLRFTKSYREGQKQLNDFNETMHTFSQQKVAEGRKRLENGEEAGDFIMSYLQELDNIENGVDSRITEDWLCGLIKDFFLAGSETSTTTLTWMMLYMAKFPEVQAKIQREIDETFGGPGPHDFTLSEKSKLNYLEATIHESQRLASIASVSLLHTTMSDVKFRDFFIPKDTVVIANLYNVSRDASLWGDPDNFRPERYIDETGKPSKPEHWIPYSMGRRMCLGEQLARQELYLFFSNILNHFHIRFPADEPEPDLEAIVTGVRKPKPYRVIFEPRF